MTHELVEAFAAQGQPLGRILRQMLDEEPKHRTERRGCGLTQATRHLGDRINVPRDALDTGDLVLFAELSQRRADTVASCARERGWAAGWRNLSHAPQAVVDAVTVLPDGEQLLQLDQVMDAVSRTVVLPESRLLLGLMADILSAGATGGPQLPPMADKPEIGSCSQAEEFFLEIAHGKVRRGGSVNIIVDDQGRPLLVEKMNLGESFSAMFLQAAVINGVRVPPGALAALRHHPDVAPLGSHAHGDTLPLTALAAVRFLRLTTLVVAPEHRERAFSAQFRRQVRSNMLSPASTTLQHLHGFADACMQAA